MLGAVYSVQDSNQIYLNMSQPSIARLSPKQQLSQEPEGQCYESITYPTKLESSATLLALKSLFMSQARSILQRICKKKMGSESSLATLMKVFENEVVSSLKKLRGNNDLKELSCIHCIQILREPVTLTCGHSVCRKCLANITSCPVCNSTVPTSTSISVNVLLLTILKKYDLGEYTHLPLADIHFSSMMNDCLKKAISKYSSLLVAGAKISNGQNLAQDLQRRMSSPIEMKAAKEMKSVSRLLTRKRESCAEIHSPERKRLATAPKGEFLPSLPTVNRTYRLHMEVERVNHPMTSTISIVKSGFNEKSQKVNDKSEEREATGIARVSNGEQLLATSDFNCSLCMSLYHEPVCTPCGHSFCKECLERCLDHNSLCPLCRAPIERSSFGDNSWRPSVDETTQTLIKNHFRNEYEERLLHNNAEMKNLKISTPIFVCTVALPSVTCLLHVFEPRYRLMLRRVLDIHNEEFGMCTASSDKPFHEIGTILRVRTVSCLPDGRSVVDSVGMRRFEVESFGTCDGYNTAQVRYITDQIVEEKGEIDALNKTIDLVYRRSEEWLQTVDANLKQQIFTHFGQLPAKNYAQGPNGPDWAWWIIAVLPIGDKIKVNLLGKQRLQERLVVIYKILNSLKKRS